MKITKQQLKKIIKEELKKTLYRDEIEEGVQALQAPDEPLDPQEAKKFLEKAIYMVLVDNRPTVQNPLSLVALFNSQTGAVLRYLKEFGLDAKGIEAAMDQRGPYAVRRPAGSSRPLKLPVPGQPGKFVELKQATIRKGFPGAGQQGVYMEET